MAGLPGVAARDLSECDIDYLFVDGIAERIRPGQRREPVLAAWGFTSADPSVLLHLMAGSKEDAETVSAFFQDMRGRRLGDPLLVVSDGAPGVIKAIDGCFPRSARQRCLAHRMRNLAVKVPEDLWPDFKARVQAAYQAPSRAIAHLRLPVTHRRATRTTNLLERLFLEERRRLKIIPSAFGEKAVLKLMFAAMTCAAERWRAVKVTDFERRQMVKLREELDHEYEAQIGLKKPTPKENPANQLSSTSQT